MARCEAGHIRLCLPWTQKRRVRLPIAVNPAMGMKPIW